jgi:hypothetical protein
MHKKEYEKRETCYNRQQANTQALMMGIGGGGMKGNLFGEFKESRSILRGVFVTSILLSLFACAVPGIKQSAVKSDDVMDFVDKNYDKFIITYCGEEGGPTAIRFDLKNDGITLTGKGWYPVESKAQLNDMLGNLTAKYHRYSQFYRGPYLFEIQTKEDRVIGYFYCLLVELNIRQEGNNYWMGPVTEADLRDDRKLYSIKGAGG